jgi:diaminohydroxyphosphoribosylaminopyrimidine deaminase/5-amino-6-(5-phosphoribosylamino)uracil reductase
LALAQAGGQARGATAYVTFEPCAHHGRTPPCAQALIDAGVARVVIGAPDPDPRVDGRGEAMLHAAGIAVTAAVCKAEAEAVNGGFLRRIRDGRPMVTLKVATTLDGRIATRTGDSKWITGALARARGHMLRARHDAILVGSGTVLADDPELTCRLPGLADRSPVRVVLDGRLRTPLSSRLVETAGQVPVILFARSDANGQPYADAGVDLVGMAPGDDGGLSPAAVLSELGNRGFTRVLIEGGAAVAGSYLRAGLVDELAWFRAPAVIGADGLGAIDDMNLQKIADVSRFRRIGCEALGDDLLESYVVRA